MLKLFSLESTDTVSEQIGDGLETDLLEVAEKTVENKREIDVITDSLESCFGYLDFLDKTKSIMSTESLSEGTKLIIQQTRKEYRRKLGLPRETLSNEHFNGYSSVIYSIEEEKKGILKRIWEFIVKLFKRIFGKDNKRKVSMFYKEAEEKFSNFKRQYNNGKYKETELTPEMMEAIKKRLRFVNQSSGVSITNITRPISKINKSTVAVIGGVWELLDYYAKTVLPKATSVKEDGIKALETEIANHVLGSQLVTFIDSSGDVKGGRSDAAVSDCYTDQFQVYFKKESTIRFTFGMGFVDSSADIKITDKKVNVAALVDMESEVKDTLKKIGSYIEKIAALDLDRELDVQDNQPNTELLKNVSSSLKALMTFINHAFNYYDGVLNLIFSIMDNLNKLNK